MCFYFLGENGQKWILLRNLLTYTAFSIFSVLHAIVRKCLLRLKKHRFKTIFEIF